MTQLTRIGFANQHLLGLAALLTLTVLAYIPGLNGPFLFDDFPNFVEPLQAWLRGDIEWRQIVFGTRSGVLGRPLAMLTFVANSGASGQVTPLPFKVTNLGLHLACGVALYAFVMKILSRDLTLAPHRPAVALLIAGIWLLHPIQVSTVLYVVQRMAQLSALFTLLGLLIFIRGREHLERGQHRAGWAHLFLLLPAFLILAAFSKENGALLPILCGVVELAYFQPPTGLKRPRAVRVFFSGSVLAPGAVALLVLALQPERLLSGYEGRLFSMSERLMTQPRAVVDYIGMLLFPSGQQLGIYTDDFVISRGLLDPPSTILSIIGLLLLSALTWRIRRNNPVVFLGIGIFLVGHSLESTALPLELYFEHRNYLPSTGLFIALVGTCHWIINRLLPLTDTPSRVRRWVGIGSCSLLLALTAATWIRTSVWSTWPLIVEQGVRQHPQSLRAKWDQTRLFMQDGRFDEAKAALVEMSQLQNPAAAHVAAIQQVLLSCIVNGETQDSELISVRLLIGKKLELSELLMFQNLARHIQLRECKGLTKKRLADLIVEVVDTAPQPEHLTQLWRSRFIAATLYASAGDLNAAERQLSLAWATKSAEPAVGVFLAQVQISRGATLRARDTLDDVRPHIEEWDRQGQTKLVELDHLLMTPQM